MHLSRGADRSLPNRQRRYRSSRACGGKGRDGVSEIRGVSGQGFVGTIARTRRGELGTVSRVKVGGTAFYAGRNEFICEAADPFSFGFELPAKFADLIP